MSAINTMTSGFFAVATSKGMNPDTILVDSLTSQSPLLKHMQWSQANRSIQHTYRDIATIEGVDTFELDGALPDMKVTFNLNNVNLTPFGGRMELGEDTARLMGNPDVFFREQSILLAREAGQKLEKSVFERIVATAIEKNKVFCMSETPSTTGVTIAVVSWNPYETCGLFSPRYDRGEFFELEKYHKGAVYPNRQGVNVFGAYAKFMAGLLLANPKSYAVLRNVPVDTEGKDFPKKFATAMADVIDAANPNENCTVIMPRAYKVKLAAAVSTHQTANTLLSFDPQFNLRIVGVPVIGSPNIPLHFKLRSEETASAAP